MYVALILLAAAVMAGLHAISNVIDHGPVRARAAIIAGVVLAIAAIVVVLLSQVRS